MYKGHKMCAGVAKSYKMLLRPYQRCMRCCARTTNIKPVQSQIVVSDLARKHVNNKLQYRTFSSNATEPKKTVRNEMGEIRGELTYYRNLISSDRSKHETQTQLVRPLSMSQAPICPKLTFDLLNGNQFNLPNALTDATSLYSNRITVLFLATTAYSNTLLQQWRDAYIDYMTNHASEAEKRDARHQVQFMTIYMLDRWLTRKLFGRSFVNGLKQQIDADRHAFTGITLSEAPNDFVQTIGHLRQQFYGTEYSASESTGYMTVRGRMFGNVVVIDNTERIRWMTIGKPANNEHKSYFVQMLMQLVQSMNLSKSVKQASKLTT